MSTATGYEAAHILANGTPGAQELLRQLHNVKALLFRAPEELQPELRAEVGKLTQQARTMLRAGGRGENDILSLPPVPRRAQTAMQPGANQACQAACTQRGARAPGARRV